MNTFKNGQLVYSKKSGCLYSVVCTKNRETVAICKLRNVFTGGHATVSAEYLKLIGNNFKSKAQVISLADTMIINSITAERN